LSLAIDAFLRYELSGKSPQTETWYRRRLGVLVQALGADRELGDIQEVDLMEYCAQLERRKTIYAGGSSRPEIAGALSPSTRRGYVRAVKRLFRWLFTKNLLTADLSLDLHLPRIPRGGKKGISEANLRAILIAAKGNARDFALLRFLESTGCRVGGVAGLLLSDLNLDAGDLRLRRRALVREKGNNERTVLMTPNALAALEAWLAVRSRIDDEHVFLGKEFGERSWHRLTTRGIAEIIARYKERLELIGPCSPHQWRHRFCRKRLQEHMDLSRVSQLAGHSDPAITIRYYGGFSDDDLQTGYDEHVEDLDV
jgi:integrase/recombinase XerD